VACCQSWNTFETTGKWIFRPLGFRAQNARWSRVERDDSNEAVGRNFDCPAARRDLFGSAKCARHGGLSEWGSSAAHCR
jgi:hypothetical protein